MPHINGRFYANPAYGRGVERAREREKQSATKQHTAQVRTQRRGKDDYDPATTATGIANQIYNETSGLRPIAQRGRGSDLDFQQARFAIAQVIRNRAASGMPGGLASPVVSGKKAEAMKRLETAAYDAHGESLYAAHRAVKEADPTHGAKYFYLEYGQGPPRWAKGRKPVAVFDPFINRAGGGGVGRARATQIVIVP